MTAHGHTLATLSELLEAHEKLVRVLEQTLEDKARQLERVILERDRAEAEAATLRKQVSKESQ